MLATFALAGSVRPGWTKASVNVVAERRWVLLMRLRSAVVRRREARRDAPARRRRAGASRRASLRLTTALLSRRRSTQRRSATTFTLALVHPGRTDPANANVASICPDGAGWPTATWPTGNSPVATYTRSMLRRVLAALAVAIGIVGIAAPAAADGDQIARLELTGVIDQVNATFIEEALRVAVDEGSAAAIIQIDSPG